MKKDHSIYNKKNGGFSIIEVVLASALLGIFVTAFMGAFLFGQEATYLSGNRVTAARYAEEGIEIVKNIADDDFDNLIDGTYGVATSSNQWVFSGSNNTRDIFTRTITITEVSPNEKEVTSNVTWQQNGQRVGNVSISSRFTNWQDAIPVLIGNLVVDVSNSSYSPDTREILGVTLSNTGNADLTIVSMETSWTGVPGQRRLEEISMNNFSVWAGSDASGGTQDILDQTIPLQTTIPLNSLRFNNNINGIEITIIFNLLVGDPVSVTFTPGGGGPVNDIIPPNPVLDLSATNINATNATLAWTATGDDGNTGTATTYDIRYSSSNITEASWGSASQIVGEPSPQIAGSAETLLVSGLSANTTYYFAMKVSDEVPNESTLSNVTSFTTTNPTQASFLTVNTGLVQVNPGDNTQVTGITIGNSSGSSITISTMVVSWTGGAGGNKIQGVQISGSSVWTGNSNSGATLNITDFPLSTGASGVPINFLDFSKNISGATLALTFNMIDGSQKVVSGISL